METSHDLQKVLKQRDSEIELFSDVVKAISSNLDLDEVLMMVAQKA